MNEYIVERIEAGIAVCELADGSFVKIPLEQLPENVCEGDCIIEQDGVYIIDEDETQRRREYAASLLKKLANK
ncbi:MAG: DUF3006 domain-containing protein [Oscillospiraceae bacterium]|nr:DUF3006 domain-containing protein [Oscillospiraceae bacterium]